MKPQTHLDASTNERGRHSPLSDTVLRDLRAILSGENLYPKPRHRLEKLGLVYPGSAYLTAKGREALEHSDVERHRGWMTPGPNGHITPEGLAELREREARDAANR